jgi:pyruvate,water dikinase
MTLLAWLQDLDRDAVARAGGKAANLGELIRAGLPVPPGFVVTTDAYTLFVSSHGLQPEIERLAQSADPDDAAALDAASRAIADLFDARPIPEAIRDTVLDAYSRLGSPPVAVRSSATAEDRADASFAGQMETYLNIRGADALLNAVRRCWASLWTARAISYRARQGIPPSAVRLAVVVQELVDADAAGVLFTANPVTGHRGQTVIDAVPGLGEALVAGQVTPDHWVLDTATRRMLEARIARKERMTARTEGGTALLPLPDGQQDRPALDDATLAALLDLGRRAAAHFGAPQDVEWATAKGRLYLVQSRPITSLFPVPRPEPLPEDGLRVYVCANVIQGIVEPLTPMGIAVFRCLINSMAAFKYGIKVPRGQPAPVFKVAAGRLFIDFTVPLRHPRAARALPRMVGIMDRHISAILTSLLDREPRLAPVRRRLPVRLPVGFAVRLLGRLLWVEVSPETAPRRLVASAERLAGQIERQADRINDPRGCRRFIEERLAAFWPQFIYHAFPIILPGFTARFLAELLLGRWLNDPGALQPVLRSLPHNPTMEMDLTLWRISRALKRAGSEPSADHPLVRAFLVRYGHRGVREIDVGMPRWRDDPEHVLNVLRIYLAHDDDDDPEEQFRRGEQAAEEAGRALVERVRREKGWLRARLLQFLLRRVRALLGRREFPKFLIVRIFAALRAMIARAGAALVAAGRLDRAEDVFFLDLNDLDSPGDLRRIAARNRAEYDRELGRKVIPRVMTSEGETFYTVPGVVPGALVGTPASAGCYEGTVRIVLDPTGAKLLPGEVLVAPGTDPAWTPLFLSAGALVMELGGIMSHGSVVAREYGIPAVVGVPDATRQLRTGQRVRVDGESGQVVPLPDGELAAVSDPARTTLHPPAM